MMLDLSAPTTSALRRGVRIALIAAITIFALAGCAAPAPTANSTPTPTVEGFYAETAAALQGVLDEALAIGTFPGAIARVITPDGVWEGAVGTAGPDDDAAPAAGDITRVGSITKTMTGTVLLQLVGEGKVSLDDTLSTYIPDIPNGDVATLRQVADMTSGIPSYSTNEEWQKEYFGNPETQFTPQQLVDFTVTLPVSFAPGEGWEYSNSNYILIGLIIEQVTGQPIAEVFEERLFGPLGMTNTAYADPDGSVLPSPHLSGITEQGQPAGTTANATYWSPTVASMAGQVSSTLDDLEKWGHALFTGEGILTPEMQQVRRDSILTSPPPNTATAGYGIALGDRDGWWGHTGEIPGFNTALFHNYDLEATIIVVVNSDIPMSTGGDSQPNPAPYIEAAMAEILAAQ
jgi:D-alanyl-D-alanine carboxypeptidase